MQPNDSLFYFVELREIDDTGETCDERLQERMPKVLTE